MGDHAEHADQGWDNYAERVLRNEGRLLGLERLVEETRESDRKLVEQRSESLAQELERRATALEKIASAERQCDVREYREALAALKESGEQSMAQLRELNDTAIRKNFEQSDTAIRATEEHSIARYGALRQQVDSWRESDREARELAGIEVNRRLDALNHADEKRQEFQANAVTRELFVADKEAQTHRESVLRDQIIALDRTMLTLQPAAAAERIHQEMSVRNETAIAAASKTLDTRINVLFDQINDLKSYRDTQSGRAGGYSSIYGWGIAAVGAMVSIITVVIVIANVLTSK